MSEEKQEVIKEEEPKIEIRLAEPKKGEEVEANPTKRRLEQDMVISHTVLSILTNLKSYQLQAEGLEKVIKTNQDLLAGVKKHIEVWAKYADQPIVKQLMEDEKDYLKKVSEDAKKKAAEEKGEGEDAPEKVKPTNEK